MSITGLYKDTFYPQTITLADDGMGGRISTWTNGTAFRGRLSSLSSNEKMASDKVALESTHKLFCNHQTFAPETRIVNSASTRCFEIQGIVNPSNISHHMEILVKEIDTNG